jgi:UPF0755 protein
MTVAKRRRTKKKQRGCLGTLVRLTMVLILVGLVIALVGGTVLTNHYREFEERPLLEQGDQVVLVIPPNTSWPQVVARVTEAGLIENDRYFDFWGRRTGLSEQVRAGTFRLDGPLSLDDLATALRRGGLAEEVALTFPEGLTIFHVADRLEAAGIGSRDEVLELARDPERFGVEGVETLEGYLFPDTYRFAVGASAEQVIARMVRRFEDVSGPLFEENREVLEQLSETYEMSPHQVVILASLIERETGVTDERDLISRVFYNRLDRGMRLETDPTCVYGESTYLEVPRPTHCRDPQNPYSTYVIHGLPPGPIASPGRASLLAALRPSEEEEAFEYLFFVARRDGTGSHYFSRTYDEHRQAIRRFLMSR